MTVSALTTEFIRNYLRLDDSSFDSEIEVYKASAIEYVKGRTNLNAVQIETHEDITIAVLVLISDMFENHLYHQNSQGTEVKTNKIVESILDLYAIDQL